MKWADSVFIHNSHNITIETPPPLPAVMCYTSAERHTKCLSLALPPSLPTWLKQTNLVAKESQGHLKMTNQRQSISPFSLGARPEHSASVRSKG